MQMFYNTVLQCLQILLFLLLVHLTSSKQTSFRCRFIKYAELNEITQVFLVSPNFIILTSSLTFHT